MANYELELVNGYSSQLLLHIDGAAGTGKSYLIEIILAHLEEKASQHYKTDPVLRAARTGVTAFNIHGRNSSSNSLSSCSK